MFTPVVDTRAGLLVAGPPSAGMPRV